MLNDQQIKAVNHVNGPALISSVPGSGKTAVIVERTVKLIENGVPSKNILCLTFTNKAAKEMRDRIAKRIGNDNINFFIGTFHSLCASILRRYGNKIGYSKQFTIFDQKNQEEMIFAISKSLGLERHEINVYNIMTHVNNWRENLESDEELLDRFQDKEIYFDVAKKYLDILKEQNIIDFSGLLYETVNLFDCDCVLLSKFQEKMKYIQLDEMQDSNFIQYYLMNKIGGKYRNIFVVGDINQCVIGDTKILTDSGYKKAQNIKNGDYIKASTGIGIDLSIVNNVFKKYINNKPIITIRTKTGKVISTTPEHTHFAGFVPQKIKKVLYFVYLMYRKKYGFRIGTTRLYASYKGNVFGFKQRLNQEMADRIWIIKICHKEVEARYFEQYYATKYGIPTWIFKERNGSKNSYNQKYINKLFKNLNTLNRGMHLLKDMLYFFDYPHYVPKCMVKRRRRNFSITLCGDRRSMKSYHRYTISGSDNNDKNKLLKLGLSVRKAKTAQGWRLEGLSANLGYIYNLLERVRTVIDVNVIEKALLSDISLPYIPASQVLPNMSIYIYDKSGKIAEDIVISVEKQLYTGDVFDFNIDRYHNFIANDIVTHNSIYAFRGARYKNITDFLNKYKDCKHIPLGKNYRSTPQIIECADKLIRNNSTHMNEKFETDNPDGPPVRCREFQNPSEEAKWIANCIVELVNEYGWNYSDCAILYRLNYLSLELQTAFSNLGIPFVVIGGPSFFDRKEIRDCLAMLKFLVNPSDSMSFYRIANLFNGIGSVTISKIEEIAKNNNINILEACKNMEKFYDKRTIKNVARKISDIFDFDFSSMDAGDCLSHIIRSMKYYDLLQMKCQSDYADRELNVKELINSATAFGQNNSIEKYLQNIALITSNDKENNEDSVSLLTGHASKGLEFPIVFLPGVEQGILPHARSLNEAKDKDETLQEERRILYVMMTRAKKNLFVSYNKSRRFRSKYGDSVFKYVFPSQFLVESRLIKKKDIVS